MVGKQRIGFTLLGLTSLISFFTALQALSVPIFIFHLIVDVRASAIQKANISFTGTIENYEDNNIELLKQAV